MAVTLHQATPRHPPAKAARPPAVTPGLFGIRTWKKTRLVIAVLLAGVSIGPLLYMLSLSFQSVGDILAPTPVIVPARPTVQNYVQAWTENSFSQYFLNSVIVSVATVVITVVLAALAAFAFARYRFRLREVIFYVFLASLAVPSLELVIPQYLLMDRLHLLDSLAGLVLIYVSTNLPFSIFLLRGFFEAIPKEYEESFRLDGAGTLRVLDPAARAAVDPRVGGDRPLRLQRRLGRVRDRAHPAQHAGALHLADRARTVHRRAHHGLGAVLCRLSDRHGSERRRLCHLPALVQERRGPRGHPMIRHRPLGRGHPYLVEPDQLVPPRPVAGEPYELRATSAHDLGALWVELSLGGKTWTIQASSRGEAVPEVRSDYGVTAKRVLAEGHLSDAVARLGTQRGRTSWSAPGPVLEPGQHLEYRFVAGEQHTRWFGLEACQWRADGGSLVLESDEPSLACRVVPGSTCWLANSEASYGCRFALSLEAGEHVVGFGERFNGLDQRGKLVDVAVFDQYKGQGARSYLPMPFAYVIGTETFGFHLDTGHRVRFDVGASDPDRLWVEVDLEPGEANPQLVLRLFDGPPAKILSSFVERTGGLEEPPPEWIYRLWMSGNEWDSQAKVMAEVERSEQEGIPVGVVVIEAWSDEQTFVAFNDARYEPHPDGSPHQLADFEFPPEGRWPDPKAMVDELHRRGTRVLLWQIPLVRTAGGQAEYDRRTMIERRYCVFRDDNKPYRNRGWWFPGALLPDFTNAEASAWWTAKRRYLLEEVGVDGFKTDGGEHAWGSDLVYADGTTGGESNNRYPVHYVAAYHSLMRDCGVAPVTFSRAGFTGAGAYPCHWAGDEDSTWEAFRASISAGITAGACGVTFWGWDVAGFSGKVPSAELFLRSAAMAALCPIMQYHSEYNRHRLPSRDRTPWNVAEQTGDPRVLPLFRRFVELRERLVPHLVEEGARAVAERRPLMRALFFEVDDESVWDFPEQYFLGEDLVVVPVTAGGAVEWPVYVPPGEWIDPWSDDRFSGPAVIIRPAPIEQIPVLVRSHRAAGLVECFRGVGPAVR